MKVLICSHHSPVGGSGSGVGSGSSVVDQLEDEVLAVGVVSDRIGMTKMDTRTDRSMVFAMFYLTMKHAWL